MTDIWSSDTWKPYLAVTAHWIAGNSETLSDLNMKSVFITFHHIQGNHTGESLAHTILYLLDRAGVTVKTGYFTANNAKNNIIMMKHLELLLAACELPLRFDASDRHIMCFPHIMNICLQHISDEFSAAKLTKLAMAWVDCFDDDAVDKDLYLEAIKKNLVALGCEIVCVIHASGIRHDEFMKTIKTGNLQQWFKSSAGELSMFLRHSSFKTSRLSGTLCTS
jgi:hypothetical protein